jgi:lysophospholipase L1-like esterase
MYPSHPRGPLVFFGASYLSAWKLERLGGIPVVNCAEGGLETNDLVQRFEQVVKPVKPRAVVIWGFNDFLRAPYQAINQTLSHVCENHRALIRAATAASIEPILMTALTLRPPREWLEGMRACFGRLRGKPTYQSLVNEQVLRLNGFLRDLAARQGFLLLDVQRLLSGPDGLRRPAYARPDGNHISPRGYAVVTEYAAPLVAARLGGASHARGRRHVHAAAS